MKIKGRLIIYTLISGLFLLFDQVLKYFARLNPDYTYYLWKPWLGWEYFPNPGIAFSLPVPNWLVIIFTPLVLLGLIFWYIKYLSKKSSIIYHLSFIFILTGAISNYIDRVIWGVTIDYLRIFTGIINLADVMIVAGVLLLIIQNSKIKK